MHQKQNDQFSPSKQASVNVNSSQDWKGVEFNSIPPPPQVLNWTSPPTSPSTPKEQERPTWTATSVVRPKLKLSKTLKSSTTTTIHTQSSTHLCSRWDACLGNSATCIRTSFGRFWDSIYTFKWRLWITYNKDKLYLHNKLVQKWPVFDDMYAAVKPLNQTRSCSVSPGSSWSCCDLRWRSHPQEPLQCCCGTNSGPEQDQRHGPGRQYAPLSLHSTSFTASQMFSITINAS